MRTVRRTMVATCQFLLYVVVHNRVISCRNGAVDIVLQPPQPATWSYHAADCQPTAPVPLVSLVQSAGTLYRTI